MPCSIPTGCSGSQTATLATDHTLRTETAPTGGAIYQLRVDTAALVNGETLTLTLRTEVRSTDTVRTLYTATFAHVQGDPIKDSPAIGVVAGADVVAILRQDDGTGRDFPWALYRLDA